jgi:hypothetical protein
MVEETAILVWKAGAEVAVSLALPAVRVAAVGLVVTQAMVMPPAAVAEWRRQEGGTAGAHVKHGAMKENPGSLEKVKARRDNQSQARRPAEKVLLVCDSTC